MSLLSKKAALKVNLLSSYLKKKECSYACSYMRKWDEQLLKFSQKPYLYKRYIDDGIGIWTEGEKSLLEFANHAMSIHPRIKVTITKTRLFKYIENSTSKN